MDFYPDFFNVGENIEGNLSAIGLTENEMEERVRYVVSMLKSKYGLCVSAEVVTATLEEYQIPYLFLPRYMKDIIDELDVY